MQPNPTWQHHSGIFFSGDPPKKVIKKFIFILLAPRQGGTKKIHIYWGPGSSNLGDYNTKHHSPYHHILMRPKFLHTDILVNQLRICRLQGCVNYWAGVCTRSHGSMNNKAIIPLITTRFNPKYPTGNLSYPHLVVRIILRAPWSLR